MIYARVHDQTVEADYFTAIGRVEQRLQVGPEPEKAEESPVSEEDRVEILTLAEEMANPEAEPEKRQSLFEKIWVLLARPNINPKPAPEAMMFVSAQPVLAICAF